MNKTLQKKTERAIRLLQSIRLENDEPIEIAYSGGKDSDVILELARMADIKYKAIYKCTTIDPPGTIKHALDNGCEIRRPKKPFFQLLREQGLPNRFMRFCCRELKEYPIYYNCVIGVRKAESTKRNERYKEPVVCREYSSKSRVQQILPILDWTDDDVWTFLNTLQIEHCELYDQGWKRIGCIDCPMSSEKQKIIDNKRWPHVKRNWIKAIKAIRAGGGYSKENISGGTSERTVDCGLRFPTRQQRTVYQLQSNAKPTPIPASRVFKQLLF